MMTYNEIRKAELVDKLSDAAISVAVAEQQLQNARDRLAALKAEYDGILRLEARA